VALLAGPRYEASSHRLVTNEVIDAAQFDARSSGSEPKVFALVATAGGIIMASVKALWMARRNGHNGRDRSRAGGPARDERGGGRLSAKLHVVIVILHNDVTPVYDSARTTHRIRLRSVKDETPTCEGTAIMRAVMRNGKRPLSLRILSPAVDGEKLPRHQLGLAVARSERQKRRARAHRRREKDG